MWAIYHKGNKSLVYAEDSKHYLIFASKVEAWSYLINIMEPENLEDFDVIQIVWARK